MTTNKLNSVDSQCLNAILDEFNKTIGNTQGQNSKFEAVIQMPRFEKLDEIVKDYYPEEYGRSYVRVRNAYFELTRSMLQNQKKSSDNNQYKS